MLGVAAILAQDPTRRPARIKRAPAPRFHTACPKVYKELRKAYSYFLAEYREAVERLERGSLDVGFPPGCNLPRIPTLALVDSG